MPGPEELTRSAEATMGPSTASEQGTIEKTIGERPCRGEHGDRDFANKFKSWLKPRLLLKKTKKVET